MGSLVTGVIEVKIRNLNSWTNRTGATILEVLVVLSIIAMIAAVAGPRLIGYLGRAKSETADLQIKQLGDAVQLYYIDVGRYPNNVEGLSILVNAPPGEASWAGPYMSSVSALIDPWGREYLYEEPEAGDRFDIISLGRDGRKGGEGEDLDISY